MSASTIAERRRTARGSRRGRARGLSEAAVCSDLGAITLADVVVTTLRGIEMTGSAGCFVCGEGMLTADGCGACGSHLA